MEVFGTTVQPFLAWLLETTLVASVVICLILILQKLLGRRLGPRWSHALWLVLLLRMVLPWTPPSPISLFSLIPASLQRNAARETADRILRDDAFRAADSAETTEGTAAAASEPAEAPTGPARPQPDEIVRTARPSAPPLMALRRMLPLLWLVGAVFLGGYLAASNFALWRIVKREHPLVKQPILELFEQCKSEMGIETIVALVPSDRVKTAALFGFVRPRLLLPREMIDMASPEELRYIFLHELAHLKRHDIYIGWLTSLLQVLHWFNPLVWLAFYRMRSDRELACDALVLTRTTETESHDYGRTMVGLLGRFSRSRPLPAMAGILESKTQLRRRIAMIAKFKNNSYQWSPLAVIVIIILACISLPDAKHTRASETTASQPANQPKFTRIRIPTGTSWDMHLSPDGQRASLVSDKKLWIMPLAGQLGPDIPGRPVELDTEDVGVEWTGHTWSGDSKWIAFNECPPNESKEENKKNQRIYIVSTEGGRPRKVHENYRDERTVNYRISLSPRGKTLAFSSVDLERKEQHIYTIPVDGGSPRQLVDAQAREPVFSPDGKTIAFVEDKNLGRGGGGLWVVPAQGGTPKHVADAVNASSPVWSPNGDMIAFLDYGKRRNQINFIPVGENGEAAGDLITLGAPAGIDGIWLLAGWSPDNRIGAIFERRGETGLYTLPAKGGKAMQVARGGGQPRWSPDGERIFIVARARRRRSAWQRLAIASIPAEGGSVTTVPIQSEAKIYIPPFGVGNRVSPDGKMIVFSGKTQSDPVPFLRNHIWTVPVEGGTPKQITPISGQTTDMFPCWSPDGKAIAFMRTGIPDKIGDVDDYDANIYIVQASGGEPTSLTTEPDNVSFGPIEWSPDGQFIAYFSQEDDASSSGNLRIISAHGDGKSRVIGEVRDPHPGVQFAWSPDSKRIAFSGPDGKVIRTISIEDGSTVNIKTGLADSNIGGRLDWSPDGEKFVFVAGTGERNEFWVMENFLPEAQVARREPPAEPTLRQIEVRTPGRVHSRPSPDGRYLSGVDVAGDLIVRELATGKQWRLTRKEPESKDFAHGSLISPDSTRVAYYWLNAETEDFDLRVVGLDGSNDRLLWAAEDGARSFNMRAWSPDGKHIFGEFLGQDEPVRLIRVSADDGSREVVKEFDRMRFFTVDISPDGRHVAYDVADSAASNRDILALDLEGNRETPLVTHSANDKLLGWTPDGRHIFFASDRNGTWDGWLLRVDAGTPRGLPEMIKAGLGDVSPVGFTRSGSFYYQFRHQGWNVYVARLDPDTGEVRSEPGPVRLVGKDVWPDWSPDGRYLAYCSEPDRSKAQIIRIRTLATGQERELKPDLARFDYLRWCPDSRHLLITNFGRESPSAVYRLDATTGEYTALVQSDQPGIRQAELSADGKTLAYRIRGLGTMNRLMVRDLETRNEKEVLQTPAEGALALAPGSGWALSPDGKHVAFSIREGAGKPFVLKIMAVESGECRTLDGEWIFQMAWTPDGRDLLVTKNVRELWRVSAETGEPRKLLEWKGMIMGPRIHPDGQRLAFFSGARMSELWVMENFLPAAVARALQ